MKESQHECQNSPSELGRETQQQKLVYIFCLRNQYLLKKGCERKFIVFLSVSFAPRKCKTLYRWSVSLVVQRLQHSPDSSFIRFRVAFDIVWKCEKVSRCSLCSLCAVCTMIFLKIKCMYMNSNSSGRQPATSKACGWRTTMYTFRLRRNDWKVSGPSLSRKLWMLCCTRRQ